MKIENRQLEVLRAIIEEFVESNEPVGSKALAQKRSLGVSPATIRNDMALLEEAGLITHPHTSAGRIPTNQGYRLFVDKLAKVKPLSTGERRAIESFLEGANDLDEIVSRTVKLLSQVTRQVAVVQYPSLTRSKVRHIELIALSTQINSPLRAMIVLITESGRVEQSVIELNQMISDELLIDFRNRLNNLLIGQSFSDISERLSQFTSAYRDDDALAAALISSSLIKMAIERAEERVLLAGRANLTRTPEDFNQDISSIMEALEEQVVLLRLVSDLGINNEMVKVRIGEEQPEEKLRETSFIGAGYANGATLGILGPTRMDYANSMSSVGAVARYLSRFFESSEGEQSVRGEKLSLNLNEFHVNQVKLNRESNG
ncbi:MAG: heat-inducible transcriptional repressor HrcA [Actinomycetota bacterium]|nr:heat-inducible transcriptional repressor HrcA [Actinomycetota bacterium]